MARDSSKMSRFVPQEHQIRMRSDEGKGRLTLLNEAEYHLNMEIEEGLEISTRVFIKRQTSDQC